MGWRGRTWEAGAKRRGRAAEARRWHAASSDAAEEVLARKEKGSRPRLPGRSRPGGRNGGLEAWPLQVRGEARPLQATGTVRRGEGAGRVAGTPEDDEAGAEGQGSSRAEAEREQGGKGGMDVEMCDWMDGCTDGWKDRGMNG